MSPKTLARRKKLRAIVYIRVSQEREEGYSPEQQLAANETFAKQSGIDIVDVVYDLDVSGRGFAKRKVMQIIQRIEAREADCVLVWKWSRFGRNLELSKRHIRLLEEVGGQAFAATENFDTKTTTGKFGRDQMLLISELQTNMIGDSWRETHERRRKNGRPHTGRERFGYTRCPECHRNEDNPRAYARCKKCEGVLQPDPTVTPFYRSAYYRYLGIPDTKLNIQYAAESAAAIALDSIKLGIRSTEGNYLTATTLLQIMDTGFAAGYLRARSEELREVKRPNNKPESFDIWVKGKHKAIIEEEVWEAYKKKRLKAKGGHDRAAKYSVSGFPRCQGTRIDGTLCHAKMCAASLMRTKGGYRKVMRCPNVWNRTCTGAAISLDKLERLVREWLDEKAQTSDMGELALQRMTAADSAEAKLALVELELTKVKAKLSKLTDGWLEGLVDAETYSDKKEEFEADKTVLESRIDLLNESISSNRVPNKEALLRLRDLWPKLTDHEKRNALRMVIDHIKVYKAKGHGKEARIEIVPKWDAQAQAGPFGPTS
ncbi:recombinase family protein [Streptomyces sp. NPDC045456]|uniref:recombinase family protein n=1 Tax=Streptomyces sp. NPDC045456 TaxID=3155254 RepID=UPI0033E1C7D4